MNQMTPMTPKRKASKKDSLQEKFNKNVELVGVYDNAEDMIKDLEKQPKKQKRKTRFETESDIADMVEQTRAMAEITKNARNTLYEDLQVSSDEEEVSQSILAKLEPPPSEEKVETDPPSSLTVEPASQEDEGNEGFRRMVRLANIFQSPGFQQGYQQPEPKQPEPKPEPKADLTSKFPPWEQPKPPVDMFQPSKVDYMVCPFHFNRLEQRTSKTGWRYVKCPFYQCCLFCDEKQALVYMQEIYRNLHPNVYDDWDNMTCFCGGVPTLWQSFSDKNPNRLYLTCSTDPRCKFFRWADQPIVDLSNLPTTDPAWKDPLSVQRLLKSQKPAAPPPPKYSDSYQNWQKNLPVIDQAPQYSSTTTQEWQETTDASHLPPQCEALV